MENGFLVHIFFFPAGKIVNYMNLKPSLNESIYEMRTDKPRSAGNYDFHIRIFFLFSVIISLLCLETSSAVKP